MGYAVKRRRCHRLKDYNYNNSGYYFITICTKNRKFYFGDCIDGKMVYSQRGLIARKYLLEIKKFYKNVDVDEFVVMPNHIHVIIIIDKIVSGIGSVGTEQCSVPTLSGLTLSEDKYGRHYGLLSKVIKSYKNAVTKEIRKKFRRDFFQWHRSFHDHVIRNSKSLEEIRRYIRFNSRNWEQDRNNLINIKKR